MSIYRSNPDALPDDAFVPAELAHLVVGNRGRLLDHRRTPVSVVDVRMDSGSFVVQIEDFEDRGARWEVPFERFWHYQFERGARRAAADRVRAFAAAIDRFDRPLRIEAGDAPPPSTSELLVEATRDAGAWLRGHSRFLDTGSRLPDPALRTGSPALCDDLDRYAASLGLAALDRDFTRTFVSNPCSGDLVKGHRIVLAELGLVTYDDTIPRDPGIFAGDRDRSRRRAHIAMRLGFVRALFAHLGHDHVRLHRGTSFDGPWEDRPPPTFVSATFSEEVARSHYDAGDDRCARRLLSALVPVERVFMTYLETRAMNTVFREAEAVLLAGPPSALF